MLETFFHLLLGKMGLLGMISLAGFAGYFFAAQIPFIGTKLRRVALLVGIGAGAAAVGYGIVFGDALEFRNKQINRQNSEAIGDANEGSTDRRSCIAQGKVWSVVTGRCTDAEEGQ